MPALRENAPAKINLSLTVRGRRSDGYHELQSLVVFAGCGDVLSAVSASSLTLEVTGPFRRGLAREENNLVLKAATLLADHLGVTPSAHLTLEKNLPVASGIGGGSADAAAALRLLCTLHDRKVEPQALAALALCIGADVPVCLGSVPALMWGKGEMIAHVAGLPEFWMVLVNPGVAVSTASVFGALDAPALVEKEAGPVLPAFQDFSQLVDWLKSHGNDLEAPAISIAPVIKDVIAALNATASCRLARMSGSGATCFGLYADEAAARRAEAALRITHPDWWVMAAPRLQTLNRSG